MTTQHVAFALLAVGVLTLLVEIVARVLDRGRSRDEAWERHVDSIVRDPRPAPRIPSPRRPS